VHVILSGEILHVRVPWYIFSTSGARTHAGSLTMTAPLVQTIFNICIDKIDCGLLSDVIN